MTEPAPTDDVVALCTCGHSLDVHTMEGACVPQPDLCPCMGYVDAEVNALYRKMTEPAPTDDVAARLRLYRETFQFDSLDGDEQRALLDVAERLAAERNSWRTMSAVHQSSIDRLAADLAAARAEAERLRYASLDWQDKYHALRRQVAAVRAVRAWVEEQSGPLDQQAAFYDANVRAALDTEETP
jgi:hypothetical protein